MPYSIPLSTSHSNKKKKKKKTHRTQNSKLADPPQSSVPEPPQPTTIHTDSKPNQRNQTWETHKLIKPMSERIERLG